MEKLQKTKTYDELIDLLYYLDKAIEKHYPNSEIDVKLEVVGGFSLIYHGLRVVDQTTRDIDTLNEIEAKIWKIAHDIDSSNWLSDEPSSILESLTQSVKDNIEFVKDTRYRFPYNHIHLWIATLSSVLGMKLNAMKIALDNGVLPEGYMRPQDIADFKDIIKAFGINSFEMLVAEYPHLQEFENVVEKFALFD